MEVGVGISGDGKGDGEGGVEEGGGEGGVEEGGGEGGGVDVGIIVAVMIIIAYNSEVILLSYLY